MSTKASCTVTEQVETQTPIRADGINLSTGAAIIAAGAGLVVAKHGNRAMSSKAGSADVLEALGIPVDLPAEAAGTVLKEAKIAFLFAQTHHPAMRHAAVARRELGMQHAQHAGAREIDVGRGRQVAHDEPDTGALRIQPTQDRFGHCVGVDVDQRRLGPKGDHARQRLVVGMAR